MQSLKKENKGCCAVTWDRNEYKTKVEKQLFDKDVYKQVSFKGKKHV